MVDKAALLIIDMLNRFDFDDARPLVEAAHRATGALARRRDEARAADVPVIYVNDNYGQWQSTPEQLIDQLIGDNPTGGEIARRLAPGGSDYLVIKPEFSGFYATNLPAILPRLGVSRLILTGVAADICVLFTAADAHMLEYVLWIPADAIAGVSPDRTAWAIDIMRDTLSAEVAPTSELALADWIVAAGDD
ncbi:cysteine hydrolase family protein [Sphingomonas citricola]|uniref:cysteine hydrolase family protein n=1 Tax=Sphingomonas citricola TaxID=2862498 RepID=UPI0027E5A074|nr:isochorismatase family cysteine hydrolase [Sphingomonas citricola]